MNKKKILIADDDPAILDALKLILEDEDYIVVDTVDGQTVQKVHGELPDLILLDIWMSGMDGREICKILKSQKNTKHIPIIMVSANRDTEKMSREAGADDFLLKPFDIKDLLFKVKKHL